MGERLLCKQEVIGSNPFTSTNPAFGEDLKTPSGATRAECCLKGEESVCHVTEADRPRGAAAPLLAKRSFACREAQGLRRAYPRSVFM